MVAAAWLSRVGARVVGSGGELRFVRLCQGAVVAGFAARVALWAVSEGSNDIRIWMRFARDIEARGHGDVLHGLFASYAADTTLNHPPLMALYAVLVARVAHAASLPYPQSWKLVVLAADAFAVVVLLRAVRARAVRAGAAAGDAERQAWKAAALFSLHPVSIWITAFHGNTDSLCALLAFTAAALVDEEERPFLAGLVLAAALDVKLIPLVLVPALFVAQARSARHAAWFTCGGLLGALPFLPPILEVGGAFYRNAIAYNSHRNRWGLHWFLESAGAAADAALRPRVHALRHVGHDLRVVDRAWAALARYVIMGASLAAGGLARLRARQGGAGAVDAGAIAVCAFLFLAPGIGIQYFVYPVLFLCAVDLRLAAAYAVAGGAFVSLDYLHFMKAWWPLSSTHDGVFPLSAAFAGIAVWLILAFAMAARTRTLLRAGR